MCTENEIEVSSYIYTDAEVVRELAREIAMRRALYPHQVKTGKLTQEESDRRINILLQLAREHGGHGDRPEGGN